MFNTCLSQLYSNTNHNLRALFQPATFGIGTKTSENYNKLIRGCVIMILAENFRKTIEYNANY